MSHRPTSATVYLLICCTMLVVRYYYLNVSGFSTNRQHQLSTVSLFATTLIYNGQYQNSRKVHALFLHQSLFYWCFLAHLNQTQCNLHQPLLLLSIGDDYYWINSAPTRRCQRTISPIQAEFPLCGKLLRLTLLCRDLQNLTLQLVSLCKLNRTLTQIETSKPGI